MTSAPDERPTVSKAGRKLLLSSIGSRPFDGLIDFNGSGTGVGLMRASWNKAADNLVAAGLANPYVHGGYEITDQGRILRDELAAELAAELEAAETMRGMRP